VREEVVCQKVKSVHTLPVVACCKRAKAFVVPGARQQREQPSWRVNVVILDAAGIFSISPSLEGMLLG
jgi:hypothetical protein